MNSRLARYLCVLAVIALLGVLNLLRANRAGNQDHVAGDPEEVGDQRYTLVCRKCGGKFVLSAIEFHNAFSAADNAQSIACARCGARRAHVLPSLEPSPEIEVDADVANDPEKIRALVLEKHDRIQALEWKYHDASVIQDPARKKSLDDEYRRLHEEAEALTRRWAELVDLDKADEPSERPPGSANSP